jgi:hypothetical protein
MAVKTNKRGFDYARELIADGRIAFDDPAAWSEHQPSARDCIEFVAGHGWGEYARWHLAVDEAQPAHTRAHYRFPIGDFRDVHRCAIRAAMAEAGRRGHDEVKGAAGFLDTMLETVRAKTG